jgi:hypothetical protein
MIVDFRLVVVAAFVSPWVFVEILWRGCFASLHVLFFSSSLEWPRKAGNHMPLFPNLTPDMGDIYRLCCWMVAVADVKRERSPGDQAYELSSMPLSFLLSFLLSSYFFLSYLRRAW